MNHTLSVTYNEDRVIQELQTRLYDELTTVWNTTKLDAYGRVYKNEKDGRFIPQVFDATSQNYKTVFYNGQSCFFFVDDDTHILDDEDHEFTTDVKIVFMLKLSDLKVTSERADADVKKDVLEILTNFDFHYRVKKYIKGVENVLREFDTSNLNKPDMQPYHVFAFETSWSYSVT